MNKHLPLGGLEFVLLFCLKHLLLQSFRVIYVRTKSKARRYAL